MKTLKLNEMEVIEGGIRFWGADDTETYKRLEVNSSCQSGYATVTRTPCYALFIRVWDREDLSECVAPEV